MRIFLFLIVIALSACEVSISTDKKKLPITGTWQLVSGSIITGTDTVTTDYTGPQSMIKIINDDHFSFLKHDTLKGKDSAAIFEAGGGRYSLSGDQYTEYLEYCSARNWEGHTFTFTLAVADDTLTQSGVEKLEGQGIDRKIVEKYVKLKAGTDGTPAK